MSIPRGTKKQWTRIVCADGIKRAFLCPIWTNRHSVARGTPFNDKLYECAHCGESIINDPPGQLKKHKCREG